MPDFLFETVGRNDIYDCFFSGGKVFGRDEPSFWFRAPPFELGVGVGTGFLGVVGAGLGD